MHQSPQQGSGWRLQDVAIWLSLQHKPTNLLNCVFCFLIPPKPTFTQELIFPQICCPSFKPFHALWSLAIFFYSQILEASNPTVSTKVQKSFVTSYLDRSLTSLKQDFPFWNILRHVNSTVCLRSELELGNPECPSPRVSPPLVFYSALWLPTKHFLWPWAFSIMPVVPT